MSGQYKTIYDEASAIPIVIRSAEAYEKELNNRNLLFVSIDRNTYSHLSYLEVSFRSKHFMHLTGLSPRGYVEDYSNSDDDYTVEDATNEANENIAKTEEDIKQETAQEDHDTDQDTDQDSNHSSNTNVIDNRNDMSAKRFYSACLLHKLRPEDFVLNDIQTTSMKLAVIESVMNKRLSASMIGTYNKALANRLKTEKLVGNERACVGFVVDENTHEYVPDTLLNSDTRRYSFNDWTTIIAVYRKNIADKQYSETVYFSKNPKIHWERIHYSEEFAYLPKPSK